VWGKPSSGRSAVSPRHGRRLLRWFRPAWADFGSSDALLIGLCALPVAQKVRRGGFVPRRWGGRLRRLLSLSQRSSRPPLRETPDKIPTACVELSPARTGPVAQGRRDGLKGEPEMGKASRRKHGTTGQAEHQAPIAFEDYPLAVIAAAGREHIARGATVFYKFTCEACGERCIFAEPNTLSEIGECAVCGHSTDLRTRGGNYLLAWPNPSSLDEVARALIEISGW
jgi:hypothetical protein